MQQFLDYLYKAAEQLNDAARYVLVNKEPLHGSRVNTTAAIKALWLKREIVLLAEQMDSSEEKMARPNCYTAGPLNHAQNSATEPTEVLQGAAEPAEKLTPAPDTTPEKEVTPAPTADGEKDEKKAAPIATPPASKPAEQTAPKAKGWVEKPKSDDKLNSASQENYADKSDADLDKERRLLCRDAVLKGAQPEAVRNFTIEKFGVRTVGAIPREKHGEWVRAFKETFGV